MKFQVVHDFGQTPRIQAMHLDPCQVASVTGSQPPTWLDIGHAFALAIRASQKTAPASRFPLSSWCHLLVRSRMEVGPHASQNHWGELPKTNTHHRQTMRVFAAGPVATNYSCNAKRNPQGDADSMCHDLCTHSATMGMLSRTFLQRHQILLPMKLEILQTLVTEAPNYTRSGEHPRDISRRQSCR